MPIVIFTTWCGRKEIIKWYGGEKWPKVEIKKITHIRMSHEECDVYLPIFRTLRHKWIGDYVYFAEPECQTIYRALDY